MQLLGMLTNGEAMCLPLSMCPSCSCTVKPQPRLLLCACSDVEHKQMSNIPRAAALFQACFRESPTTFGVLLPIRPFRPAACMQAQAHLQQMLCLFSCDSGGDPSSLEESLVELDDGVGIGNLPFVNGVLLGYPFVYHVSAQNVNRASAWLSASRLQLFRCCLSLQASSVWPSGNKCSFAQQ